jgi:hypothetical protein
MSDDIRVVRVELAITLNGDKAVTMAELEALAEVLVMRLEPHILRPTWFGELLDEALSRGLLNESDVKRLMTMSTRFDNIEVHKVGEF